VDLHEALTREPVPSQLTFSMEEYEDRLARVRASMASRGFDVLLITNSPNQSWLTGYQTVMSTGYSVAVVPAEGEVVFHVPELDVPCVLYTGWVREIEVFYWSYPLSVTAQLAGILRDRGYGAGTIGVEMSRSETFAFGAMDAGTYQQLQAELPEATFQDATNLVQDERICKSPAELEYMRKAGELSAVGIRATIDALANAPTEAAAIAAGTQAMIAAGSELMSIEPLLYLGERGGWAPHTMYARRPISRGDIGYMEYSGNFCRYNAPMMRTVSIGKPSDRARRLADASAHMLELLLENIKPGRTGHDVAMAAKVAWKPVQDWAYFHQGYGYAVGLGFPPTWTEAPAYIAEGIERELVPGMTFHLPLCVWVPREFAVGYSETALVTEGGCTTLSPGTGESGLARDIAVVDR
jgi:Xaa-Pro dipeptidase